MRWKAWRNTRYTNSGKFYCRIEPKEEEWRDGRGEEWVRFSVSMAYKLNVENSSWKKHIKSKIFFLFFLEFIRLWWVPHLLKSWRHFSPCSLFPNLTTSGYGFLFFSFAKNLIFPFSLSRQHPREFSRAFESRTSLKVQCPRSLFCSWGISLLGIVTSSGSVAFDRAFINSARWPSSGIIRPVLRQVLSP